MESLDYLLALLEVPGIASGTLFKCQQRCADLAEIFSLTARQLRSLGFTEEQVAALKNPAWDAVEKTRVWAEEPNQHILTYDSSEYPLLLKEINHPPYILFVKGQLSYLNSLQLAIVGSRNPTLAGRALAQQFAYELASQGLTVTSGMALGIDGASHQGALDAGKPTIAVLGTGLQYIYPQRHRQLAEAIAAMGALVSEFPLNTPAHRQNFPRRNRIISGLTEGVLVIEAAMRSGSLITAKCALEQGREVFAIPHSIHNPLGKGYHMLLRQGAKMVESVTDIFEEIIPHLELSQPHPHVDSTKLVQESKSEGLAEEEQKLLKCLGREPVTVAALLAYTDLSTEKLQVALMRLELKGLISQAAGQYQLAENSE